ncbi:MAG: hypothetical protein QOK28_3912 [Actinomycetota bacterium]|jgi:hypothetical protein
MVAVAAALIVAGTVGVFTVHADPSANALVARARAFVGAHATAKFHGVTVVRGGTARSPIADAETAGARVEGELHAPGRAQAVISDDDLATELVLVGRAIYVRDAEKADALPKTPYVRADAQHRRIMRLRAEQAKALDLGAVLAAVTDAKILRRKGDTTTVEADVGASALFGRALGGHVDWVTLRALVGDDGELHGAQLLTRAEATVTTNLQFSDWGDSAIRIAAPPAAQLDTTPPVARVKLASFKTATLLVPKTLPAGWELVRADVLPASDTQEGCAQAELAYEDQSSDDTGYLYLYEFPRSCASRRPSDATPFNAGKYNGFAASQDGPYVQITAGNTAVQAVTDLPTDRLAATLSELVPLALQSF